MQPATVDALLSIGGRPTLTVELEPHTGEVRR